MNNPITQSTNETCNIVQDLLPLYYDDVCSPSSKRLVEKHLKTCEKCQNLCRFRANACGGLGLTRFAERVRLFSIHAECAVCDEF